MSADRPRLVTPELVKTFFFPSVSQMKRVARLLQQVVCVLMVRDPRRFVTPEAIMEHFFRHRLTAYERRKAYQVAEMGERVKELNNRARYCTMVHDGGLSVVKKKVLDRIQVTMFTACAVL